MKLTLTVVAAVIATMLLAAPAQAYEPGASAPFGTEAKEKAPTTYVLQSGDTLTDVAHATNISVRRLVYLNRIPDANYVIAGFKLRLQPPRRVNTATAPPAQVSGQTGGSDFSSSDEGTESESGSWSANWDAIAFCESRGNWAENEGTIYDGGLQFHPDTWLDYGGSQFAPEAWMASREQQIVIGERVLAEQGPGAWPNCFVAM